MLGIGTNGGLIGPRRVPSTGSASGVWDPEEQKLAKGAGIWPLSPSGFYRYYRLDTFANTSLNANTLEIAEVELYNDNTVITGVTATGSFTWDDGSYASIVDANTSDRNYKGSWSGIQSSATITFDMGSAVAPPTHIRIFVNYGGGLYGPRFPASFNFNGSNESNANFANLATVTVGTSLNEVSQDLLYVTNKVAIS
jgi:hypothetical protein